MGDTALVLVDPYDQSALDIDGLTLDGFERVIVRAVDYDRLDDEAEAVASQARELGVKFVLYSRNDQVFARPPIGPLIRRLRTGYSSFSGIDQGEAYAQARLALADLKRGHGRLILPPPVPPAIAASSQSQGTFSLIFDTEQIGGARFGMPRILELLGRYGVRAIVSITGFIFGISTVVMGGSSYLALNHGASVLVVVLLAPALYLVSLVATRVVSAEDWRFINEIVFVKQLRRIVATLAAH
jgi:hypothetical protein